MTRGSLILWSSSALALALASAPAAAQTDPATPPDPNSSAGSPAPDQALPKPMTRCRRGRPDQARPTMTRSSYAFACFASARTSIAQRPDRRRDRRFRTARLPTSRVDTAARIPGSVRANVAKPNACCARNSNRNFTPRPIKPEFSSERRSSASRISRWTLLRRSRHFSRRPRTGSNRIASSSTALAPPFALRLRVTARSGR